MSGITILILFKSVVKWLDNNKKVFNILPKARARALLNMHVQAESKVAASALSLTAYLCTVLSS